MHAVTTMMYSHDVIGHVTIWLSIDNFLYVLKLISRVFF